MTVHDFGFALTFGLLLFAPELPMGPLGAPSLAFIGFGTWLLLSINLPLLRFTHMPSLLAMLGFGIYALLVSLVSASLSSIAYAAQFTAYTLAASMLLPAYFADPERQARGFRILAWLGAIYCAGLIVSLWTGPFWEVTGSHAKHYQGATMLRGVGFASSVNLAGGIAAIIALFALLLYRPGGKVPIGLACLAIAGMAAAMSRAAIVGFVAALMVIGGVSGLRLLLGGGVNMWLRAIALGAAVAVSLIVLPAAFPQIDLATDRLVLDPTARANDVDARVASWQGGFLAWRKSDLFEQMVGGGMKSAGRSQDGVYVLSHSMYVTILQDFGVIGLLLFGSIMAAAMATFAGRLLRGPDRYAAFGLGALIVIAVENVMHPFSYSTAVVVLTVLAMACGELARVRRVVPEWQPELV